MANPILVNGAAGRVGGKGRTVTELLLKQGKAVRATVGNEDDRAQALRDMGAEVVIGDPLDLDSMAWGDYRLLAGLLRHVCIRRLPGSDRDQFGGRSGIWSQRFGQHVANDSFRDEHPEHHAEPSAAAALAQR